MILLIDNYDSFTFNLVHFLGDLGARCEVRRNDTLTPAEALALGPRPSSSLPGLARPRMRESRIDLITAAAGRVPILGVCLGHQAIGQAFGGEVKRAPAPVHGKLSRVFHEGTGLFEGLPSPFEATRYHSLIVDSETLPASLAVTARTENGLIMGLCHREFPIFGVQFHPESIASQNGHELLANFLSFAPRFEPSSPRRVIAAAPASSKRPCPAT